MWYILERNRNVQVYIPPHSDDKFKKKIKSYGVAIAETAGITEIKERVFISDELKGLSKGETVYEHGLVLKSDKGLVFITGCAHPGLINIVRDVKKKFNENIYFLMGGFHLKDKENSEILGIIEELKNLGVKHVAPLHCTGRDAIGIIKKYFGNDYISLGKYIPYEIDV